MESVRISREWEGETVVCIATGPSLTQADCDYVRGKARVIAINDAHRLAPWADVLYSSDRYWWPYYNGVPSFNGMRYGIGSEIGTANAFPGLASVLVLRNTGWHGLETNPSGLRSGRNSGYAAINLAVHFGAARILLLGYNMAWVNGSAHFFGNHPKGLTQNARLFPSWRRAFDTLIEPLAALGVQVINCTEHTCLDAFPCQDLREVLMASRLALEAAS